MVSREDTKIGFLNLHNRNRFYEATSYIPPVWPSTFSFKMRNEIHSLFGDDQTSLNMIQVTAVVALNNLPGEAELAAAASLADWQHVRVRRAGEQELSNLKRSGNAESPSFPWTVEPLNSADAASHCCVFPGSTSVRMRSVLGVSSGMWRTRVFRPRWS